MWKYLYHYTNIVNKINSYMNMTKFIIKSFKSDPSDTFYEGS